MDRIAQRIVYFVSYQDYMPKSIFYELYRKYKTSNDIPNLFLTESRLNVARFPPLTFLEY